MLNLQTFTSFQGRIPRMSFWLGILILIVITWVLEFILFALFGASMMPTIDPTATPEAQAEAIAAAYSSMMVPLGILTLIMLWPSLALYTKRWHDRNKSGWWTLILFIPIVGPIWLLIELGFLRGTEGPNRFGEDPLAGK